MHRPTELSSGAGAAPPPSAGCARSFAVFYTGFREPRVYTGLVATIHDVARLAGVSPTTAKRALRAPDRLHPDTLSKVQDAIQTLHYEPDQRAGGLRGGRSNAIGLVVGSVVEPFFAELTRTLSRRLHDAGYALITTENEYDGELELESLRILYGQRVPALIVRPGYGGANREYLERLHERGVFIVQVDYCLPGAPFCSVMLDNAGCVRQGVRYLHSLGHTRIAALGSHDPVRHPEERSHTFPLAMQELGLTLPPEYERVIMLTEEAAYRLTLDLMRLPQPPTALFSLTGTNAAGAYRALRELGLRLARDVSLLTFDNYAWTELVDPQIDVIEQPVAQMGEAAARIVLEALEQGTPAEPMRVTLPGKLIVRGSSARV